MHITPLAWIGIILIGLVFVVLNIGLVALLRNRDAFRIERPTIKRSDPGIHKLNEVLRDPFAEERSQMSELSDLVRQLKEQPPDPNRLDDDD